MKQTKKRLSRGRKIALGAIALVLLAIAGYFAFAYTTDYLRYRTLESYDQALDGIADEVRAEYGNEAVRREKYCYDHVNKLSHELRCQTAIFVDEVSEFSYDVNHLSKDRDVKCWTVAGLSKGTARMYCGIKMREWTPYRVYENITDLYQ